MDSKYLYLKKKYLDIKTKNSGVYTFLSSYVPNITPENTIDTYLLDIIDENNMLNITIIRKQIKKIDKKGKNFISRSYVLSLEYYYNQAKLYSYKFESNNPTDIKKPNNHIQKIIILFIQGIKKLDNINFKFQDGFNFKGKTELFKLIDILFYLLN